MGLKLFFKKTHFAKNEFILPEGTVVCGAFQAKGNGIIDGRLKGDVNIEGKLIIGKNAEIKGDVHAMALEVHGSVYGNIFCTDKLEINNTAFIKGNITAAVFEIKEGALIEGLMIKKADAVAGTGTGNIVETHVTGSNEGTGTNVAEEKPLVADPVPEKSTDHDKVVSSWF